MTQRQAPRRHAMQIGLYIGNTNTGFLLNLESLQDMFATVGSRSHQSSTLIQETAQVLATSSLTKSTEEALHSASDVLQVE